MKTLLIVYHTGGVKTAKMAEAVERYAPSAGAGFFGCFGFFFSLRGRSRLPICVLLCEECIE